MMWQSSLTCQSAVFIAFACVKEDCHISDLARGLTEPFWTALLSLHAFTRCDSTSASKAKAKSRQWRFYNRNWHLCRRSRAEWYLGSEGWCDWQVGVIHLLRLRKATFQQGWWPEISDAERKGWWRGHKCWSHYGQRKKKRWVYLKMSLMTFCRRTASSIRICRRASCCFNSATAGIALGANFKIYLLRQFCWNRVEFFYNTHETQMQKIMDQNFEIWVLWFLRIF